MKTTTTFLLSLAFFLNPNLGFAQSHPNFSGTWQQDNNRTDPKPRNPSYLYRATIHQDGSSLQIDSSVTGSRENGDLHLQYEIGGKEIVYKGLDADEFHTRVNWEGGKLVFHTIEHERGSTIPSTETWTLSDDGHTLTRVKQEAKPGREPVTRTFVLAKQ